MSWHSQHSNKIFPSCIQMFPKLCFSLYFCKKNSKVLPGMLCDPYYFSFKFFLVLVYVISYVVFGWNWQLLNVVFHLTFYLVAYGFDLYFEKIFFLSVQLKLFKLNDSCKPFMWFSQLIWLSFLLLGMPLMKFLLAANVGFTSFLWPAANLYYLRS